MGTHAANPAQAHGGLFVFWVWNLGARHAASEDLGAQESKQGGDEGIGNQYGDDDRSRSSDGHGAQERDADNGQRGQGDDHGGAGEDNGTARGAQRHAHGVGTGGLIHLLELLGQFLWRKIVEARGGDELVAEAVDNKQRVIDADCQANHGGQCRGHIGDGIRKDRGYLHAEDADAHADNGGNERHASGHEGTEGNEQHDRGDDEADNLGAATHLLTGGAKGIALVLHGEVALVVLIEYVRDLGHVLFWDVHDGFRIKGDGDGAGGLILAQRGELLQVFLNLLVWHVLGLHLFAHLLFHAGCSHHRADQLVLVLERASVLELAKEVIYLAGYLLIGEVLSLWSLDDHGAFGCTHGIGILAEALHHLVLGGGGVHLRHGEIRVGGLGKAGGKSRHGHQDDEPKR